MFSSQTSPNKEKTGKFTSLMRLFKDVNIRLCLIIFSKNENIYINKDVSRDDKTISTKLQTLMSHTKNRVLNQ